MLLTLFNSLRFNEGIGAGMQAARPVIAGDSYGIGYVIFLLSFWLVVFVMFLSIVQGIIVDTFARTSDRLSSVLWCLLSALEWYRMCDLLYSPVWLL